jgi:hypothetical protein
MKQHWNWDRGNIILKWRKNKIQLKFFIESGWNYLLSTVVKIEQPENNE